jgi:hypothetical protein
MHIGSTKMRILSIFAGKSKTMENLQNESKSLCKMIKINSKSRLLHDLRTVRVALLTI